jgi:hypothetical protein
MSEHDRGHHLRGWQRAVAQTLAATAPD